MAQSLNSLLEIDGRTDVNMEWMRKKIIEVTGEDVEIISKES